MHTHASMKKKRKSVRKAVKCSVCKITLSLVILRWICRNYDE